ncbi:citrate lyase subunit beta / citryl-CoA lyase [Nocardioides terrae]|uniref:Citrate lyase subunit beta / citryl-CoA lyase n=1 Tax=Nocardioides terrae TaxID=574651 RepID=A0A1I1KCR7_9ACTN|nr:CoA ester lyase [Nocardioides terrae]SFC58371.1 citrate lyase subunit beta / citryl-CoA lyase [Nocardioides terrae]
MIVALYVPGSRPDRFDKAAATGATVILDLEDSVAADDKAQAREHVAAWLRDAGRGVPVQVRVNAPRTPELAADLAALPPGVELRIPKVEDPEDLVAFGGRPVHVLVETARGVERLLAIATAEGVRSIGLGEADLAAELGLEGEDALGWIRSRTVVAAKAAQLPPPMMAAYPAIADLDGLAESCASGRRLGMRGRTAIHPRQLPVIRSTFAPRDDELAWAEEVLAVLGESGVGVLADGSMVDAAMARRARAILGR